MASLRLLARRPVPRGWTWGPAWLPALSLRLRLTLLYTSALATALCVLGLALYLLLVRTLGTEADQVTVSRAHEIAQVLQVRTASPTQPLAVVLPQIDVFSVPGTFIQVTDIRTGAVVARSANLDRQALPLPPAQRAAAQHGRATFQILTGGEDRLHVYSLPVLVQGRVVGVVQVGRSLGGDDLLLRHLRLLLALGAGTGLPAAAALAWLLAGRALAPIKDFARAAEDIGRARDFSRRVAHDGPSDEVGHLAVTLNAMLSELEEAHRDIAATNARLEQTLAAQRRFVADASHELRTPLTTIRANADILRWVDAGDPTERDVALSDLSSEAERMSRLVNDLLTLARADAGSRLALSPTPLRPLIEEAIRQARLLTAERQVNVATADDVMALANPDALKQLVLILLDNALKYTPPGGQVMVTLRRKGAAAQLEVTDTGTGIAPADLPRIFERFYRADVAREIGGSGLGLAIAHWIIAQHGGSIEVASTVGRGSTFTVCLPIETPS